VHRDQHDRKLWGVLGQIFSATESNRFTAESQNLWGEIFMAPHHFFGYNDARNVFEVSKVLLPKFKRVYWWSRVLAAAEQTQLCSAAVALPLI